MERWLDGGEPETREAAVLADLHARHGLPEAALRAFLQGMRDDLQPPRIATEADLDLYCYRVAGAVGELMTAILGVTRDDAWGAARALGLAMQRTNVLRDVDEDLANGRVYLAAETLARFGVDDLRTADRERPLPRPDRPCRRALRRGPGRRRRARPRRPRDRRRGPHVPRDPAPDRARGARARRTRAVVPRRRKLVLVAGALARPSRLSRCRDEFRDAAAVVVSEVAALDVSHARIVGRVTPLWLFGPRADTPAVAAVVPALDGTEHGLDPRLRTAWTLAAAATALAAGIVGAAIARARRTARRGWRCCWSPRASCSRSPAAVAARLEWASYRYRVTDDAVEITHGVVVQTLSVLPHRRIQQIDVRRGPIERRLGLATLVLRSAAATTDATLPGLADADAVDLRAALLARAGLDDAV